jgi:Na+:H+ antiporter, NhaA family
MQTIGNRNRLAHWFAKVLNPLEVFMHHSMSGGVVLLLATIAALVISNSSHSEAFHHVWESIFTIGVGEQWQLSTLHHWVNDGLMALFFLMVGLELKREFLVGELSSPRDAMLPIVAAVGGMIVPACIYLGFNGALSTAHGWGIPMATDIAFAVGILALLGNRVPKGVVIFLLALAIVDDLGAVLVIAFFYTQQINIDALMMAAVITLMLILFNKAEVRHPIPYLLLGVLLWYVMLLSGVHATIAGVILACCMPARPALTVAEFHHQVDTLQKDFNLQNLQNERWVDQELGVLARSMESMAAAVQSPLRRLLNTIEPWVLFLIVPLFALANAGVDVRGMEFNKIIHEPVTLGIILGLVLGKFVGVGLSSWLAVKLGIAKLPSGVNWLHILGVSWLAGIGFTMSLFVSQLAFNSAEFVEEAKLGILLGSTIAAVIGLVWLFVFSKKVD